MRFFIKKKLYQIIFLFSCFNIGYAQPSPHPGVLLKSETTQPGEYYFYTLQEKSIVLYEINIQSEYHKIWEYDFLKEKNTEPLSILYGDITGNGEKELIVVVYVFGKETEVYIFQTDDNIPTSSPAIYQLSSLKRGARPIQAALVGWDGDKDKEIAITLSSPERKVLLLDYNINKLTTIKNKVAEQFMSSTYGPIKMIVFDYNQDAQEDLILYTTNDPPKRVIYFSKSKKEETIEIQQKALSQIKIFQNDNGINEVAINKKGELYYINKENQPRNNQKQTIDLIHFSNKTQVLISPTKIQAIKINNESKNPWLEPQTELPISKEQAYYLQNTEQNIMVFYGEKITNPKLLLINDNLEWKNLTTKPAVFKTEKEIAGLAQTREISNKNSKTEGLRTTQNTPTITPNNKDSLYVNAGDTLHIPIIKPRKENIQSVETTVLPSGMFLNPEKLSFVWGPTTADVGEHLFQYNIISETHPTLKINQQDSSKLTLERVSQTDNTDYKYFVFVNDVPTLKIENKKDTINIMGSFSTSYTIEDQIKKQEHIVKIIQPPNNKILIDRETIYWEPETKDVGQNEFVIQVSDGLAESTSKINIFVDTTVNIKQEDIVTTLNKELVYQLPNQPHYQYSLIKGPPNLRISSLGEIHWIPLPTQVDENIIEIDINTGTQINKQRLNVYVNAPPVISYRPAYKEHITRGDTFVFTCQSFDLNSSPTLKWSLALPDSSLKKQIFLSKPGQIKVITDSLLDNKDYVLVLSDGINEDKFFGTIYINALPQIISEPPNYLILGDTLKYQIKVQDINQEKPFLPQYLSTSTNNINYKLLKAPENTLLDTAGLLFWVPTPAQLGAHSFNVSINDSLTFLEHTFTLFVNDKPNIISVDSLSILAGDTLNHFFDAADLNGEASLIYSIKTTIDELMFSGKLGKLTWMPTKEDLGLHMLEISVSDGFNLSTDTQKLKIFVYLPPTLNNIPDSTAYANLQYLYSPKAHDMYKDSIHNKDIFITFAQQDSSFTGKYNSETNILSWVPTIQDLGLQRLEFIIKDKYNTTNHNIYDINVLISPCETLDTLYINTTDTIYIENPTPAEQTIIIKTKSPFSPFP